MTSTRDAPTTLLLAAALVAACAGGEPSHEPGAERVTSLAALARKRAPGLGFEVWSLDRDRRAAVVQSATERVALEPVPGGADCVLRLGVASRGPDTVRLGVSVGDDLLFETLLAPAPAEAAVWQDREIPLPANDGSPRRIAIETALAGAAAGDETTRVGWSAAHVACPVPAPPPRPLVLLISLDTLRADHLGLYGYERATSPALDAFAREALVFDRAYSPAPWTLPSHASMLTGLYPSEHRAGHESVVAPLEAGVPTVAEWLSAAGFETAAFTAGGVMGRSSGLDRGFDTWVEWPRANLGSVLPEVLARLSEPSGQPLFVLLHTYDVHGPYDHPAAFRHEGASDTPPEDRASFERRLAARLAWRREAALPPHTYLELERFQGLEDLVAAYDDGIRYVDAQLGRLFDHLRASGRLDGALVIVTSDHGESLLERGVYIGHSYLLTDTEVRVPLVVRLPGGEPRGRVADLVDLVDLAPLILETAGVPLPDTLSGASPKARLEGRAAPRAFVRGEAAHTGARYARSDAWKVILPAYAWGDPLLNVPSELRDRFDGGEQVYSLAEDPAERRNRAGGPLPDEVAVLRAMVDRQARPGRGGPPDPASLPGPLRDQLRALGYLE